jgi:hypothetical protein
MCCYNEKSKQHMTGDNKMAYLYNFQFERYEDGVTYAVEGFAIFNKDDHLEIKSYVLVMKNRLTKGSRVFGSFPDPRKMLTGGFDFWMYK